MRELKPFGKRQKTHRTLPNDRVLQETFAVVNNGCDSKQVIEFISKTTGYKINEVREK